MGKIKIVWMFLFLFTTLRLGAMDEKKRKNNERPKKKTWEYTPDSLERTQSSPDLYKSALKNMLKKSKSAKGLFKTDEDKK